MNGRLSALAILIAVLCVLQGCAGLKPVSKNPEPGDTQIKEEDIRGDGPKTDDTGPIYPANDRESAPDEGRWPSRQDGMPEEHDPVYSQPPAPEPGPPPETSDQSEPPRRKYFWRDKPGNKKSWRVDPGEEQP